MNPEEIADTTAIKVGMGAAAGAASGIANAAAASQIHNNMIKPGAYNASSKYLHAATKALKQHKGLTGAAVAGGAAVAHGAVGAAVASVALPVVVAGAAGWGVYKLAKYIKDKA
jgi:hypothetical protein